VKEVVVKPLVTEKTAALLAENKYVFIVLPTANKIEIRNFVEKRFGVKVEGVNIVHVRGKKRRRGRITGMTKDRKKAIVTLVSGDSISVVKKLF